MANLCMAGLDKLKNIVLTSANTALAEIAARDGVHWKPLEGKSVFVQNVPADLADQSRSTVYPAVYLYAGRMENALRQKFTRFSGPVRFVVDLRCSGERYDNLERELSTYVEAVTTGLQENAGQWSDKLIYDGAYAVKFEPVKLGGRNFIQSAKIELEVEGVIDG